MDPNLEIAGLRATIDRLVKERDEARAKAHALDLAVITHRHEAELAKADAKFWKDSFLDSPRHRAPAADPLPTEPVSSNGYTTV